jgi:hypothetical protein
MYRNASVTYLYKLSVTSTHMHRWEDNIGMDLMDIGWEDVDWMHPDQDKDQWRALVNTEMNLRVS